MRRLLLSHFCLELAGALRNVVADSLSHRSQGSLAILSEVSLLLC